MRYVLGTLALLAGGIFLRKRWNNRQQAATLPDDGHSVRPVEDIKPSDERL